MTQRDALIRKNYIWAYQNSISNNEIISWEVLGWKNFFEIGK